MSLVYIFAASSMEGEPVRKIAAAPDSSSSFRCGANDLVLLTGAMGPGNAKSKADAALGVTSDLSAVVLKPDAVLVIGLCGGLSASLREGSVVAYDRCLSAEGASPILPCSPAITDSVTGLLASSNIQCERVVGITSSRIATNREERMVLAKHGALVVDMESYSILGAAAAAGVPAAVLRVVSDSIDRNLPDLNRALNDAGALDGRKALRVALGSPLSTARLLAANRRAMQRLTRALEIVLKAPCFA